MFATSGNTISNANQKYCGRLSVVGAQFYDMGLSFLLPKTFCTHHTPVSGYARSARQRQDSLLIILPCKAEMRERYRSNRGACFCGIAVVIADNSPQSILIISMVVPMVWIVLIVVQTWKQIKIVFIAAWVVLCGIILVSAVLIFSPDGVLPNPRARSSEAEHTATTGELQVPSSTSPTLLRARTDIRWHCTRELNRGSNEVIVEGLFIAGCWILVLNIPSY
jgi:hypothetical protein